MKILVIGSGGREHALVWKISQSQRVKKIYCAPGNPGTKSLSKNIPIKVSELVKLADFAKEEKINLTVVGPEVPLVSGITDLFTGRKLAIVGPGIKAARIEGSKVFAKKLMRKYGIPTADFVVFDDYLTAEKYLKSCKYPLVLKADGVCAGKGVCLCQDELTAQKFLKKLMVSKIFGSSADKVIIEEVLLGQEISFMAATDGKKFTSLLPSQDHKAVFEKDQGPNTGGMGAYAPVPALSKKIIKRIEKEIIYATIKALAKEGSVYKGILYPGLILTKEGPKVLEYNCRLGDPETQPLLALMETDIVDLFQSIVEEKINNLRLKWKKGTAVCVILASKGYPGEYQKGFEIKGLNKLKNEKNVFAFHAGTKEIRKKVISDSGRVLGVTALGKDLKQAIGNAYKHIGKYGVFFKGMQYRKDIGKKGLKRALWN